MNTKKASEVVFSPSVRAAQQARGSRDWYTNMEEEGGFPQAIDDRLRAFIASRESFYFGTASADGQPYIQHRGGPRGFLKVLDKRTLAFGDVAGNAQYISVGNLSENNRAFIFLMDYPNRRRIKLWGTAEVIEGDEELLQQVATGETPERVFVFHLTTWHSNCPKNIQQRWTAEEAGEQMRRLAEQIEQLQHENRILKTQLKEQAGKKHD